MYKNTLDNVRRVGRPSEKCCKMPAEEILIVEHWVVINNLTGSSHHPAFSDKFLKICGSLESFIRERELMS